MATKPVVVYGANGFSGRLIAEFLREYNVGFVAAGRSRERLQEVMSRVPGIETADYEVAEVGGTVDELAELFDGAKVVCNTAGPFLYNGPRVIEACYKAGCHYLDIAGEQAWIIEVAQSWGTRFAEKGLLAAPATAFMSVPSDIGAHLCIEAGAIDSLEILTMFKGIPTFGSTQTIFAVIPTEAYYLEQNSYKPWTRAVSYEVVVPGSIQTQLALPWGGFPHPVWFKDHPQIANVKSLGGLLDRQIMETVLATTKHYEETIRPLAKEEQQRALAELAGSVQGGTPPRENSREQRTIDVILGRGTLDFVQCTLFGTCCYRQTGLLQAYAAHSLVHSPPRKAGFASATAAFGHRELLKVLESHGLTKARVYS
jgi:NAD(P)-dependent dehydrogenase (short-subunit alcohol dehydrogenase family)